MKFLADENIASSVVKALKRRGADVKEVKDYGLWEAKDIQLVELSRREDRIILTYDKDFIALFESQRLAFSVIVVRLSDVRPSLVEQALLEFLDAVSGEDFADRLAIVERFGARIITK